MHNRMRVLSVSATGGRLLQTMKIFRYLIAANVRRVRGPWAALNQELVQI